ncbi:MAG: hypothetical protein ACYDCJ_04235 [Gammaproteobacteria bacterium]
MKTGAAEFFNISACIAALVLTAVSFPAGAAPWQLQINLARGIPGGFIQVRENNVSGTALPLGPALGIDYVQHLSFDAVDKLDRGRALLFNVDFSRIYGETPRSTPVYFNGVQLAANNPLTTNASWLSNWQLTTLYRQRLLSSATGTRLDGEIGFTYVGLTYSLQGHPAGAANLSELSGSRTSEDFITQELPVPQLGLHFRYPLLASWEVEADFLGGHLPRLYSLRNEGGKVYVTQTNQEAQLGVAYHWENGMRFGLGWYSRYFMQHEQSAEDGNYIQLTEHGLYLNLRYRF